MTNINRNDQLSASISNINANQFSCLDLLSSRTLPEKMIELALLGVPSGPSAATAFLKNVATDLSEIDCNDLNVVVFGGGTGLSTIIGGDSRNQNWIESPFGGLKELFPRTSAIVCATDDGGSTGELLKDLPLIGLGDIRHVMLSSVQRQKLQDRYGLSVEDAHKTAKNLSVLFNHRFKNKPESVSDLFEQGVVDVSHLPKQMGDALLALLERLFSDVRLRQILNRPHCLGNLIICSAIYSHYLQEDLLASSKAIYKGLGMVADLIGVDHDAVLPCTTTPSTLKITYANGISVTGESKSGSAKRGYPVDQVTVEFSESIPHVLPEVIEKIKNADVIIYAPGSLYTSIVPILQVPGLCEAIRGNQQAVKMLVANLWVQRGETDLTMDNPERRFYVSDLIKAYHRNIPGGVKDLFAQVLLLGMQDIPGSILQSYAVEGKYPIFLDRGEVWKMGFAPIEANIFLEEALQNRIVRHDPTSFAKAVKVLWAMRNHLEDDMVEESRLPISTNFHGAGKLAGIPCKRYGQMLAFLEKRNIDHLDRVADILWRHWDIPIAHLEYIKGITLIAQKDWARCQEWDNVYSFYDPNDGLIKIREDIIRNDLRFEVAFLVALGQSLLGDYALHKEMVPFELEGEQLGKVFYLTLRPEKERDCFFTEHQIEQYLTLSRMRHSSTRSGHYTRILNATEGFTPPGLLFGLTYAWYLDNRFASHIEYKMAIARTEVSDLVPEQVKIKGRRQDIIDFFRTTVFQQDM